MTEVRRLLAAGTVLVLATVFTCSHLWGEAGDQAPRKARNTALPKGGAAFEEDLARSKFAEQKALAYQNADGDTLFALQVKHDLKPAAARPRTYVILVDTSASKGMGPLESAKKLAGAVVGQAGDKDRVGIWTVNTKTGKLTRDFRTPQQAQDALKELNKEYPAGLANLKDALTNAIKDLTEREDDRQKVVLYLGDGRSLPTISSEDRADLCQKMVKSEIAFFTVPLGSRFEPQNLHGFASATGGAVVRLSEPKLTPAQLGQKPDAMAKSIEQGTMERLQEALAVPVLYPRTYQFDNGEVAESLPTKLPPLRSDVPTLMLGKLKKAGKTLACTIEGTANGKDVRVTVSEEMPDQELDNFFLASMYKQWQAAKDQPAGIRADRALAYAFEKNQVARADLLGQAEWALADNKFDAAERLFDQARQIDPSDLEAKAGLQLVRKIRDGKLTPRQIEEQFAPKGDDMLVRLDRDDKGQGRKVKLTRDQIVKAAQADDRKPDAAPPAIPPQEAGNILEEAKQRQALEDIRNNQFVDEQIREANRRLRTNPDDAQVLLKTTRDSILNNPEISEAMRQALANRLEVSLRNVATLGSRIKLDQAERERLFADSQARLAALSATQAVQDRTVERMRAFHELMERGRLDEATKQALAIRDDLLAQGAIVPPAVTAGYTVSLNGNNLRQMNELRRRRESKYLQAMLEVEYSHIPFARDPDEPQVEFPPAAKWRAITNLRKEKYESSGFGGDTPRETVDVRDKLFREYSKFEGFDDPKTTLEEALLYITKRCDLDFDVYEKAFEAEGLKDVLKLPIAEKPIPEKKRFTAASLLKRILERIPVPATYLIRKDVIEISTAGFAVKDKELRVYPVADLVIPIPSAVNQQSLQQSAQLQQNVAPGGILGQGGLGFAGGGFGALGGGLGALGGGLGIGGGLGGLGVGGLGGGVAGAVGGAGLGGGGLGFGGGGGGNLGVQGGVAGFGGGNLGQFGNLGGQFGLQGGTQEQILIQLITEVVGKPNEWKKPGALLQGQAQPAGGLGADEPTTGEELNSLGYFPPARALVVKGTTRIHTRERPPAVVGPAMAHIGRPDKERVVVEAGRKPNGQVAGAGEHDEDKDPTKRVGPRSTDKEVVELFKLGPKAMWKEALAKGVEDPGLIIAVADFLVEHKQFEHAAEFLKSNLRQGIVVRPWVYEALAVSLRESKASADEIERAEVSAADLEPMDAQGYLKAAQAMKERSRYDHAVAFCREAARLEPNVPQIYSDTLAYARLGQDRDAMEWAAGRLLGKDWPAKNDNWHDRAKAELKDLARKLADGNHTTDAERLQAVLTRQRERDLVIRLVWTGDADLDLKVHEPSGSVCSALHRQTLGGGTLIGDNLGDGTSEKYVAAQAFTGTYKVAVERVWGQPTGGKAKLEIIQHEGTPRQSISYVTLDLSAGHATTVHLEDGRRNSLASVPPASASKVADRVEEAPADNVFSQLQRLADPELRQSATGISGGVGSMGSPTVARRETKPSARQAGDLVASESRVSSFVGGGVDLATQVVVSADGKSIRGVTVKPMFDSLKSGPTTVAVNLPLIPGASQPGER